MNAAGSGKTITKTGTGTLNVYSAFGGLTALTGGTAVATDLNINEGTVRFANAPADISSLTRVNVAAGTTMDFGFVNDTNMGSLSGAGTVLLGETPGFGIASGSKVNFGTDNLTTTFSGQILGVGGRFDKVGTGTLTLTGNNTFTGPASVQAGTMVIQGGQSLSDSSAPTSATSPPPSSS